MMDWVVPAALITLLLILAFAVIGPLLWPRAFATPDPRETKEFKRDAALLASLKDRDDEPARMVRKYLMKKWGPYVMPELFKGEEQHETA